MENNSAGLGFLTALVIGTVLWLLVKGSFDKKLADGKDGYSMVIIWGGPIAFLILWVFISGVIEARK